MNLWIFRFPVVLLTILALHSSSAQSLSGGETGAFDPSTVLPSPAEATPELYAFDMNRIIGTQTMLIRHQATEYQRKVAEARARAYVKAFRREQAEPVPSKPKSKAVAKSPKTKVPSRKPIATKEPEEPKTAEKSPSKKKPKVAEKSAITKKPKVADEPQITKKPKVAEKPVAEVVEEEPPKVVAKPKKKLPRYIAVDTVKDKRSGPEVKKVVMIWDTESESLVGNNLYDVQNPPPVGATTKFETYSANYIGAGL